MQSEIRSRQWMLWKVGPCQRLSTHGLITVQEIRRQLFTKTGAAFICVDLSKPERVEQRPSSCRLATAPRQASTSRLRATVVIPMRWKSPLQETSSRIVEVRIISGLMEFHSALIDDSTSLIQSSFFQYLGPTTTISSPLRIPKPALHLSCGTESTRASRKVLAVSDNRKLPFLLSMPRTSLALTRNSTPTAGELSIPPVDFGVGGIPVHPPHLTRSKIDMASHWASSLSEWTIDTVPFGPSFNMFSASSCLSSLRGSLISRCNSRVAR